VASEINTIGSGGVVLAEANLRVAGGGTP
jgi:hypothetical protein